MADTLGRLMKLLEAGTILNEKMFSGVDYDKLLDSRDNPPFDDNWVEADEAVEKAKEDNPLNEQELKMIDEIRHVVHKLVNDLTEHHELAGYVSDDFGLIATALALDHSSGWVNGLWSSYKNGVFPTGKLKSAKGRLSSLI